MNCHSLISAIPETVRVTDMAPDDTFDDALDAHLESALEAAEDEAARFHLRQALQLRVVAAEDVSSAETTPPIKRA